MVAKNDRKFAELILYIAERSEADRYFGAIKLNKILFYADFLFYQKTGQSITGQTYQRLPNGPAPRRLRPVRDALEKAGALALKTRHVAGLKQVRAIAIREPDLSAFTGPEIAMVDYVIHALRGRTAGEASELSHAELGWKLAENGEEIPYETVFLSARKITPEEAAYALELAAAESA